MTVHIAAQFILFEGRYLRQRCAWCGAVLLDYDLAAMASMDGSGPATWDAGGLVGVDGNMSVRIECVDNALPEECCVVKEMTS